jgi:hypothetical protein
VKKRRISIVLVACLVYIFGFIGAPTASASPALAAVPISHQAGSSHTASVHQGIRSQTIRPLDWNMTVNIFKDAGYKNDMGVWNNFYDACDTDGYHLTYRHTFWFDPGRQISSMKVMGNVWPTCNFLEVQSIFGYIATTCISPSHPGFNPYGPGFNDYTQGAWLKYNPRCALY